MTLFGRDSRGESFSTLRAAALQDCTPRLRLHSFSEAVFTEALDSARLVCPLHRCGTSLSVICFRSVCRAGTGSSRALACLFENLTRVFTRRSDEPGKSREAQELTWQIQALSMHRFPLVINEFNPPERARSIALVLLCLHKRGFAFHYESHCRWIADPTTRWQAHKPCRSSSLDWFCPIC